MDVSVIINTYNNEKWIERCLQSVINQSYVDIECIVVDDCSTDNTFDICNRIKRQYPRLQLFNNNCNMGCSLTRKEGYAHSTGDYVVFIDGDDWLEKDFVLKMVSQAKKNNADLVYCDYYEEDGVESKIMVQNINNKTNSQIIAAMVSYDPYLVSSLWNKLIRRDLLSNIVFPPERYGEDMYISLQLAYYSKSYLYIPKALYHYWVNNSDSISNDKNKETERRLAMYDICTKNLLFLKCHFQSNIQFEPWLSIRINKTAIRIFEYSELRKIRDVTTLYPPAIKYIFRKEIKINILTRLRYIMFFLNKHLIALMNKHFNGKKIITS